MMCLTTRIIILNAPVFRKKKASSNDNWMRYHNSYTVSCEEQHNFAEKWAFQWKQEENKEKIEETDCNQCRHAEYVTYLKVYEEYGNREYQANRHVKEVGSHF
jgi:hypothetical protein